MTLTPRLLLVLVGLLAPRMATAQLDTLTVIGTTGAPGSHGCRVAVSLMNVEEIAGLQLTLTHTPDAITIDSVRTTSRTAGMTAHCNPKNGTIVLIDFTAKHRIEIGYGPVLEVFYSVRPSASPGSVALKARDAVLSDPAGNAVPVIPVHGTFEIEAH